MRSKALADRYKLVLIEDCAQAWGARYHGRPIGTVGHLACFSLQNSKHITCGDGGVVGTNDERFGPLLQKYRRQGWRSAQVGRVRRVRDELSDERAASGRGRRAAHASRGNRRQTRLSSAICSPRKLPTCPVSFRTRCIQRIGQSTGSTSSACVRKRSSAGGPSL